MEINYDTASATDLIRWTFTIAEEAAEPVETHLNDLGADVFVRNGGNFHVFWEEPDHDLDPIVEALWSIVGSSFEITQETFHRLDLHVLHHEDDAGATDASDGQFHPGVESLDHLDL